ncbi:histidine phosphatase family protein [Microbacteriaceae bacterium VKM Ac-2855]|nr:histidine phosphatase family protein [Microbacteriaceae bacterium VKM Ac-2855]
MTRITLVRHGQTEWNLVKRIQGTSDIPLNATGRAQARATGRRLAARDWDVVVASPLIRAHETGAIMAAVIGLDPPEILPGIAERCYGEAEGMTGPELRALHPNGIEGSPIPGLESRPEVVERATAALLGLAERHPGRTVLVATHGAVIGSLLRHLTAEELPLLGVTVGNGSAHDLVVEDGRLRLLAFDGSGDVEVTDEDLADDLSTV